MKFCSVGSQNTNPYCSLSLSLSLSHIQNEKLKLSYSIHTTSYEMVRIGDGGDGGDIPIQ
jgi:hypothetical protein